MMRKTIAARLAALLVALLLVPALGACTSAGDEGEHGGEAGVEEGNGAGEESEAGDPEDGQKLFATCAGCHGPDGRGLPNLGKDLHNNAFLAEMTDAEAVAFLKEGRAADHPLNTTGVAMPPKGGNPALTDDDLLDIVAYVRTLE